MTAETSKELFLIVEPHAAGHRLYYVRLLVDECHSSGDSVAILTTADAVDSDQWRVHLSGYEPQVVLKQLDYFTMDNIADVATQLRANVTIVTEADQYRHYLRSVLGKGWQGPGRLSLLFMRADAQPAAALSWIRPAKDLVKKSLIWGAGLRPRVSVFALRSPLVPRRGPLRWISDPITLECTPEQVRAARDRFADDSDRRWLGVFGEISSRKNLDLILDAIIGLPNVGILIAGAIDRDVSRRIATRIERFEAAGGRVVQLPGTITNAEFDSAIGAVDCVVAAHSNEGPSGVVLKAAASGRRLVLAGAESLRHDANHLGAQALWSPLEVSSLRRTIVDTLSNPTSSRVVQSGSAEFRRLLTLR